MGHGLLKKNVFSLSKQLYRLTNQKRAAKIPNQCGEIKSSLNLRSTLICLIAFHCLSGENRLSSTIGGNREMD